jgi:hypothetical protein
VVNAVGYTAWASRYLHEYNEQRDLFGYIAVNDRSNAALNPAAVMRHELSMQDYLDARMVRWPLSMLDMDVPIDGADAFIITTTERARDMALKPVMVHACTTGQVDQNEEDQLPSLRRHGQHVVIESLRTKSDFWIDDNDVFLPYDGFTFITISWIENVGWCGLGEARGFIEDHWEKDANRILIHGRIPSTPTAARSPKAARRAPATPGKRSTSSRDSPGTDRSRGPRERSCPWEGSSSTPKAPSCAPNDANGLLPGLQLRHRSPRCAHHHGELSTVAGGTPIVDLVLRHASLHVRRDGLALSAAGDRGFAQ